MSYRGHTEWQRTHSKRRSRRIPSPTGWPVDHDDGTAAPYEYRSERAPHGRNRHSTLHSTHSCSRKRRRHSRSMSRDTFLIVILCLVCACAAISLSRPLIQAWWKRSIFSYDF